MPSLPVKLFEMQEKHKTLGCTLVVTQNHLITLREDFSAPLRKLKDDDDEKDKPQSTKDTTKVEDDSQYLTETTSLVKKYVFPNGHIGNYYFSLLLFSVKFCHEYTYSKYSALGVFDEFNTNKIITTFTLHHHMQHNIGFIVIGQQ